MLKTEEYSTGWIDSTIHAFLAEINSPPANMSYALITGIDSCFDLPYIIARSLSLKELGPKGHIIGKGLIVETKKLLTAEHKKPIFFGFDEIWFFPKRNIQPKPDKIFITRPKDLLEGLPEELVEWMDNNKCSLGLGDGIGLKFVARLTGIAKYLVQHWSESTRSNQAV